MTLYIKYAEGGGAVDDPPRGDGEADPAGPDTPRAAEAPTVVPARPCPADRDVDTTPSQAPQEIAAVGAPKPTPLMPPPPPAVEAAAQQVSDAGPGSGVPLLQALQPGVRRTMPRAASTAASGVVAAQEVAPRAPAAAQAAVPLAGGHYVIKCQYLSKRARKQL